MLFYGTGSSLLSVSSLWKVQLHTTLQTFPNSFQRSLETLRKNEMKLILCSCKICTVCLWNIKDWLISSLISDTGGTPALAFIYILAHVGVLLATLFNKMQRKLDSFSLPILAGVHHKIYITLPNIFLFLVFTPMVPQLFKCADLLILLPKVVFNSFYLKSQVSPLLGFFSQLKKLSLWSVNHRTESLRCLRGVESHYCPSYSFGISKEM